MIAPIEEIVMRMDFRYQKIYKIKETTMIRIICYGKVEINGTEMLVSCPTVSSDGDLFLVDLQNKVDDVHVVHVIPIKKRSDKSLRNYPRYIFMILRYFMSPIFARKKQFVHGFPMNFITWLFNKKKPTITIKCFGKVEVIGEGTLPENIEIISNNEVSIIGQDIENVENITAFVDFI